MLQDFLNYVGRNVSWNVGGRRGVCEGTLRIMKYESIDGEVADFEILSSSGRNPNLGSATKESPFSRTNTIIDGEVIYVGEGRVAA